MAWKITKDHISEPEWGSEVGKHSPDFKDDMSPLYKFKLYDDDRVLYFEGVSTSCDDEAAFEPLDYYMADAGCTSIVYYNEKTAKWEEL